MKILFCFMLAISVTMYGSGIVPIVSQVSGPHNLETVTKKDLNSGFRLPGRLLSVNDYRRLTAIVSILSRQKLGNIVSIKHQYASTLSICGEYKPQINIFHYWDTPETEHSVFYDQSNPVEVGEVSLVIAANCPELKTDHLNDILNIVHCLRSGEIVYDQKTKKIVVTYYADHLEKERSPSCLLNR